MKKCEKCGRILPYNGERCLICNGKLFEYNASPEEIRQQQERCAERIQRRQQNTYTPKCPVCQSPNIKKLSVAKRSVHGYAFGLFSNTARSQWECLNCGNKF